MFYPLIYICEGSLLPLVQGKTYFYLARGSARPRDGLKAAEITNTYQDSRKQSEEQSKICSYSIKIIKRNILGNQVDNRTIKVAVTTKRRSNNFWSSSKHQYVIIYAAAQVY